MNLEEIAFKKVLASRQYYMVFQPIVDLQNGELFCYEALLRSSTPAFGGPIPMIKAAVEAGWGGRFGRLLRERALKDCPAATLSLNVHPAELDEGWLVRPDDPIFEHAEGIYLEITESVPLSHYGLCRSILREIRDRGVFLAVDDLGAGFSNLKYIADLAPEVVKLDAHLISGLNTSKRRQKLVSAIVRLCRDLGAVVVAEHIETLEELIAVQDTGTQYGQGFLLARPEFPLPKVTWPFS